MARGPKQPVDPNRPVNFSNVRKIFERIQFSDWLALMTEFRPTCNFHQSGSNIIGNCFCHEDKNASLMITPNKGIVKCFGSTCGKVWTNPVKFLSAVMNMNYGDTLMILRKRFGLKGIVPEALVKHYQEYYVYQQHKKSVCKALQSFLVDAVNDRDNPRFMFAKPLVDWLIDTRGIPPENVASLAIGTIPPILYLSQVLGGEESPDCQWARTYLSAMYTSGSWIGSLAYFTYDEPDNIARIKVRKPGTHDFAWLDDHYESAMGGFRGFYGLHMAQDLLGRAGEDIKAETVFVTEGEFDAMLAISAQLTSGNTDAIWLSLGGKGAQLNTTSGGQGGLDKLLELGIKNVNLIPDKDTGGVGFVQHILKQGPSRETNVRIMQWPEFAGEEHVAPDQRIKDPGEWIQKHSYAEFSNYARAYSNYQLPHEWVYDHAAGELETIPEADIKRKANTAVEWGKYLANVTECDHYCKRVADVFELDVAILAREIRAHEETEDGYVQRIIDIIRQHFFVVGEEAVEGHKHCIEFWHKLSRSTVRMLLNDEHSVETALSAYFGSLPDFFNEHLGDPTWTAQEGEGTKLKLETRVKMYRFYSNRAVLKMHEGLPDLKSVPRKAQGVHYVEHNEEDGLLAYVVNGRDAFRLSYPRPKSFEVRALDGPKDGKLLFRVDPNRRWLTTVNSVQDLLEATQVDLQKLYADIHHALDIAWVLKHHKLDVTFLAGYLCCLPFMNLFTRQTSIIINGEASSGKSRLAHGLIGGNEFPRIQLVAATHSMERYTPAAIRQDMDGCSLGLCLGEFENRGNNDRKAQVVQEVLEQSRDIASEGGARMVVGSLGGTPRVTYLKHPMICSAIHPLRDEASLSRFVTFELPKLGSFADPIVVLLKEFGQQRLNEMKHQNAIGWLPHLPAIFQANRDVEAEYATGANLPQKIPSRFRESIHPVLAIMKFLGLDYQRFAFDFCQARESQFKQIATTSEHEQLFETILSSPFNVKLDDNRTGKTTVRAMLANADPSKIKELNSTNCGVYFDAATGWIVVQWIEALQGVLANAVRYGREASTSYLKDLAQRSPFNVPFEQVRTQGVFDRIKYYTGPGLSYSQVSVFDVRSLLEDAKQMVTPQDSKHGAKAAATAAAAAKASKSLDDTDMPDPDAQDQVQGDDDMKV